jgi:hypothetical protein
VVLAIIRPDAWNFPLLLHVLGAMLMVGALVLTATALVFAWRDGNLAMVRLGYRSLLMGVIPAFILMRAGAEWIASKEGLENSDVSWIGIGFGTSDAGALLIIIATVLAGFGMRRAARTEGTNGLSRASLVLVGLVLIAFVVAIWAMTTKPT